jgi:hypothetical protein
MLQFRSKILLWFDPIIDANPPAAKLPFMKLSQVAYLQKLSQTFHNYKGKRP